MKSSISKVTWSALAILLFTLSSCSGKHENRGREIGKSLDNLERSAKEKAQKGKETAHETAQDVKKKAHELHEKGKEKAHELVNKS